MVSKQWTPKGYMRTAMSFLLSDPKSGLFLDPGMGKTSICLASIKILKYANEIRGALIVAPLMVCYSVWPGEIDKWSNFNCLSNTVLHDETKQDLWGKQKDIYIINPEGLPWLHKELLNGLRQGKKCPFNSLWIDESTKFKNHESVYFNLLVDMLPLFIRRHIMTGTPAPKNLLDLWSQIYLLDEGVSLGYNYHEFRGDHFQANDWNKYDWQLRDFAEDAIHEKVAPRVLEMSADDYLDIPPIVYNNIKVNLPKKAMKYYKKMEKEFFIELDNMEASADAAAQVSMKCHQIANGQVYENVPEGLDEKEEREFKKTRKTLAIHKAKTEALTDLIGELNGKPLLIAYHFRHDLKALRELLGDVHHIGKGVTQKQCLKIEKDWNAGKIPILLCYPSKMAYGLNFQKGGNDICWYSLTWNLEHYLQFNERIHRPGVIGKVRIHHLIAQGTIDIAIMSRLGVRAKQQTGLRTALKEYRLLLKQAA